MAIRNGWPDDALGELYPFADRFVELDHGPCMHYIEMGRAGLRRPTFLLLHGNPTWSFLYRKFMGPLSRVGRVVAVDTVGFGRSDHPEDPAYHSLEQHIANLEEFVRKLHLKRVIPVVQDWGGPIGLGYATRNPDNVAGLVVMNTWAFTEAVPVKLPWALRVMRGHRLGGYLLGRRNLFVESVLPRTVRATLDSRVMAGYRHPFPTPVSRAGVVQAPRMIPDQPSHPDWATMAAIEEGLSNLDVPACILWGTCDPVFGRVHAEAFRDLLPQAEEPVYLQDAGHFLQEDAPDEVIRQILRFTRSM